MKYSTDSHSIKIILSIHVLLGCDTISAMYGIEKKTALQIIEQFREQAKIFILKCIDKETVAESVVKAND